MPRRPSPHYRTDRDLWYVQVGGKQHVLAEGLGGGKEGRRAADRAFHRLMVERGDRDFVGPALTVATLVEAFLARCRTETRPGTARVYGEHLRCLAERWGDLEARKLIPHHVTTLIAERSDPARARKRPWAPATRRGVLATAKTLFAWGVKQGLLEASPLAAVRLPRMPRRQATLAPGSFASIVDAVACPLFRDLLVLLFETGARPGELRGLTAADLDLARGVAVLPPRRHKTGDETGLDRVIHLSATARTILARLAAEWPHGPLLRNSCGRPWTPPSVSWRLRALRDKGLPIPRGAGIYALRHLFIDDALEAGVPTKVVATLAGHADSRMIDAAYSRIEQRRQVLADAVERVRPAGPSGGDGKDQS